MAKPRIELSKILHEYCDNVYFQPSTNIHMNYPCIVYELDRADVTFANNRPYSVYDLYSIKYITRDQDDPVRMRLVYLPMCSSENMYVADNLYHFPYRLYW